MTAADPARANGCGDGSPLNGEDRNRPFDWCALPAGHAGWHKSDRGTEWFRQSPAPSHPLAEESA